MNIQDEFLGVLAIFKYSSRKMLTGKRMIFTALIISFFVVIMGYSGSQTNPDIALPMGVEMMDVLLLFFFMPVMAMIYGSSLIRDEIDDKSIAQLATSPRRRESIYMGYYFALVASTIIVMMIMVIAGYTAYFSQAGFTKESHGVLASISLLLIMGSFVYSALFLCISVLIKQPIYLGMFYAFIWEGLLGSFPGKIRMIAVKHYLRSIGSSMIDYGSISSFESTTVGTSFGVLLFLTATFLCTGALLFRFMEFS